MANTESPTPNSPFELFNRWFLSGFEVRPRPERYERKFRLPEFAAWHNRMNDLIGMQLLFPEPINIFLVRHPVPMKVLFMFDGNSLTVDGGFYCEGFHQLPAIPGAFQSAVTDKKIVLAIDKRTKPVMLHPPQVQ